MRTLEDMLGSLASAIVKDEAQHENAWDALPRANEVAQRLPLVHRTCTSGAEADYHALLRVRRFVAGPPCTERERAAGIPNAVYFFLGSGAFPDRLVGFVLDTETVLRRPASYNPFDSGSLDKYAVPADPMREASWDAAARDRFLSEHLGRGQDVAAFAGPYLAAHFREPMTYVRLGQHAPPEFPAYHGLKSKTGDRRAWTIEVRAHEDVPFPPGSGVIKEIVAARETYVEDLPDDLVARARLATAPDRVLESIAERIEMALEAEVP